MFSVVVYFSYLDSFVEQVENFIDCSLRSYVHYSPLRDCIIHGIFAGKAKRLRPRLFFLIAKIFCSKNSDAEILLASAVECLHSYSLMHDDLPVFDNDLLRRGEPSCHVAFGAPLATLSGNYLLSFLFSIVCCSDSLSSALQSTSVMILSKAASNIAQGQAIDCLDPPTNVEGLINLYTLKTAELFLASFDLAYIVADSKNQKLYSLLKEFILNLGILFQAIDDLEDFEESNLKKNNVFESLIKKVARQSKERIFYIKNELKNFPVNCDYKYLDLLFHMSFCIEKKYE